jgi:hypothetical protein
VTRQPPPPESASPALAAGLAAEVTAVYVAAEAAILALLTLHVRAALSSRTPGAALQGRSAQVQTGVRRILDRTETRARHLVPKVLSEAYKRGHGQDTAQHAAQDVLARLGSLRYGILQWVARLWSRLGGMAYGTNPRPLIDHALQQAAGRGITAIDSGRRWYVPYRVEQVVAHAAGSASMDGWMARVQDEVGDYVIVNRSETSCPICRPWVGVILSISGADPVRPSVTEARASGLWHPNCVHPALIWRPGFQWPSWAGHGDGGTQAAYEASQRTRLIERYIAAWQRRLAVAVDDVSAARARRYIRRWQTALRDHRRTYGLSA